MNKETEEKWEQWGFINHDDFGSWTPRYIVFTPKTDDQYGMSRISDALTLINPILTSSSSASSLSRSEAIDVAANLMSNSMPTISIANSKLFFSFQTKTEPWLYEKRKDLASTLNIMTRKTDEDYFCGQGWLIKSHPAPSESIWTFPPLGPLQKSWIGAVHLSMSDYVWHSIMKCSIQISEDPALTHSPIFINITTTW